MKTGNLLVLTHPGEDRRATAAVDHVLNISGAQLAGRQVPRIGLITVRPPLGVGLHAFAVALRRLPGVVAVRASTGSSRHMPGDPALAAPDPDPGVVEWAVRVRATTGRAIASAAR